jgi:hypothetical protein
MDVPRFAGPLRCYQDNYVGLISFVEYECDQRIIPGIEYSKDLTDLIRIYPNPAIDIINIEIEHYLISEEDYEIEIIDLQGKVCINLLTNKPCSSVDVSALENGPYFLRLKSMVVSETPIYPIIKLR